MIKKLAETVLAIYFLLGTLSFIISIKFGLMGLLVFVWNLDLYLRGEEVLIDLPITIGISVYVFITLLPWLAGLYLGVEDKRSRARKRKNPQFFSIIQQKIQLKKDLDSHEEEFLLESVRDRLLRTEKVGIGEYIYYIRSDSERFDEFIFRSDDEQFARVFRYLEPLLGDADLKSVFAKAPTRMSKYIKSGVASKRLLERVQRLYDFH